MDLFFIRHLVKPLLMEILPENSNISVRIENPDSDRTYREKPPHLAGSGHVITKLGCQIESSQSCIR